MEQLYRNFARRCGRRHNNHHGGTITLNVDIDLNNQSWTPIGNSSCRFAGTFDGAGYTISGLTGSVGLFGYNSGTIQKLTLTDVNISGSTSVGGGIAAVNYGGTVSNCTVSGTVSGNQYVGGIVGQNSGTVTGCTSVVTVSGGTVGVLVGMNITMGTGGTVSKSYYYGSPAVGTGTISADNKQLYKLTLEMLVGEVDGITVTTSTGYECLNVGNVYYVPSNSTVTISSKDTAYVVYNMEGTTASFTVNSNTTVEVFIDEAPPWEGDGTEKNPYQIKTAADLQALSDKVSEDYTY